MSGATAAATIVNARRLVFDLGLGAGYTATQSAASTSVIWTIKTDGSWEITFGAGDTGGGTPLTGTWLQAGGNASDYEVQFSTANESGSPIITNGASSFTAVSANRSIEVSKSLADASADVTGVIRRIAATSESVTDTSNFAAQGAP